MRLVTPLATAAFAALCWAPDADAGVPVRVTVTGEVEFNQISAPPLGFVGVGETATMTFLLDSDSFVNSASFPTRGYVIDPSSFQLSFDGGSMPLQSPFPAGQTPYFSIRDNDPAVDGFFVATSTDFPVGVPINQTGGFGQFINNFSVTYGGDTLPSLDILDALGSYDFTGLSVFNWTVDDGPFNPLGIVFSSMTIEREDAWTDLGGGTVGVNGQPTLEGFGTLESGADTTIQLTNAPAGALMVAWLSFTSVPLAALGGTVHANPFNAQFFRVADGSGSYGVSFPWPAGITPGVDLYLQFLVQDASVIHGITLSNGVMTTTP